MKLCACTEEISKERYSLGYRTCIRCGEALAALEATRRKKCVAPLYNKGAYQYISTLDQVEDIGK